VTTRILIPVCPEVAGGLGAPRPTAEALAVLEGDDL